MKSYFFLLAFCFATLSLAAQYIPDPWMRDEGTLDGFVVDSQYFTMVMDANLREKPGTDSKVLTKLPIGTKLTMLQVAEQTYSQRGVTYLG